MKLAVISHTEHYRSPEGHIVGWGPTVRELNHMLDIFEEIWHMAVLQDGPAPLSALPYKSDKIHFVPIQPFGGPRLVDKLGILRQAPAQIRTLRQILYCVDWWQFRAPTGMGVYLIPWLQGSAHIPGWFKYAGNWMQPNPPLGYRIQKFWLTRAGKFKVTINGCWPGQPAHCLSFENPCLDEEDRRLGAMVLKEKDFSGPLRLCFVGHLNQSKGMDKLLQALPQLPAKRIASVDLIGDGPLRRQCEEAAHNLAYPLVVHGYLDRERVGQIMSSCHLLVLPSRSEGFPKVVAEAANYGCVPVVSDVSAIGQYVRHGENGFLLSPDRLQKGLLAEDMKAVLDHRDLKELAERSHAMARDFTFEAYCRKLQALVLQ